MFTRDVFSKRVSTSDREFSLERLARTWRNHSDGSGTKRVVVHIVYQQTTGNAVLLLSCYSLVHLPMGGKYNKYVPKCEPPSRLVRKRAYGLHVVERVPETNCRRERNERRGLTSYYLYLLKAIYSSRLRIERREGSRRAKGRFPVGDRGTCMHDISTIGRIRWGHRR